MDGSLADIILEMGYNFTSSVEDCRNALVHFGLQELKSSTIARMLSAMIKTHSGLNENTHIYVIKSQFVFCRDFLFRYLGFEWC
jgi:CCR4-NOT transcription complex subunit 1